MIRSLLSVLLIAALSLSCGVSKVVDPPLPAKTAMAVLTFDDIYLSTYEYGYPVMDSLEFVGVLGVVCNWIRNDGNQGSGPCDEYNMSWDEIYELRDAGWEVANHSMNHPPHVCLSQYEIDGCYDCLGAHHIDVSTFIYP